jgi:hypothetical protein
MRLPVEFANIEQCLRGRRRARFVLVSSQALRGRSSNARRVHRVGTATPLRTPAALTRNRHVPPTRKKLRGGEARITKLASQYQTGASRPLVKKKQSKRNSQKKTVKKKKRWKIWRAHQYFTRNLPQAKRSGAFHMHCCVTRISSSRRNRFYETRYRKSGLTS